MLKSFSWNGAVPSSVLAVLLGFAVAWPAVFKFGVTFKNVIDGSELSANESFLLLLSVVAIVFAAASSLFHFISTEM